VVGIVKTSDEMLLTLLFRGCTTVLETGGTIREG